MRVDSIILKSGIGLTHSPLRNPPRHEDLGSVGVPLLPNCRNRERRQSNGGDYRATHHRSTISRGLVRAASVLVLMAAFGCSDLLIDDGQTYATSELLILGVQPAGGSIASQDVLVPADRETFVRFLHADVFRTVYAELRIPSGAFMTAADSILVQLDPEPQRYGLSLSPADLTVGAAPRVTFTFATYGDFSVADGSPRYASRTAYANALALWHEIAVGRWQRVSGSSSSGADAVTGAIRQPGRYVVAAPR
jgi:hypothetical protein